MHEEDGRVETLLKRVERLEAEIARIKAEISRPGPDRTRSIPDVPPHPPSLKKEKIAPPAAPVASDVSIENAIGTKWIGRVGMVAVIFGAAFFLKYSFDNRLIGETGRIILGILSGTCFIGAGEYFQKRKNWRLYGQILTGGGLAILYLSVYAAFAFYHLVSQTLSFAALIAITATGVTLSIRYSAISIATIGILGGFLTPIMLSTGENRPVSLFLYILLLDAAIAAVVRYKMWRSLGIASQVFTALMYMAWHGKFYTTDQQLLAFGIISVLFVFYNVYVFALGPGKANSLADGVIIILAALFYMLAFCAPNRYADDWYLKSFVLALSAVEIAFAGLALRLDREPAIIYAFAGISIVLNIVAVFVAFEGHWISIALAAEMVIFAYAGIKFGKPLLREVANALSVLLIVRFFLEVTPELGPFERLTLIANSRFFVCGSIIAAFYLLLFLYSKNKEIVPRKESIAIPCLLVITQFLSVYLLSTEFYDFYKGPSSVGYAVFTSAGQLSLSVVWAVYASIITALGIIKKIRMLRILGMLLIGITVFKVFLFDLSLLGTIYKIASFVMLGAVLLAISYFYNRFKHYILGESGQ